jgi:hypothetical protein
MKSARAQQTMSDVVTKTVSGYDWTYTTFFREAAQCDTGLNHNWDPFIHSPRPICVTAADLTHSEGTSLQTFLGRLEEYLHTDEISSPKRESKRRVLHVQQHIYSHHIPNPRSTADPRPLQEMAQQYEAMLVPRSKRKQRGTECGSS